MAEKSKIKVLIIGADGVARKYWVDHDATFFDSKYKIDQDAIYQSMEGFWIFGKPVATIMFRANCVIAISFKVKPSIPDPDEMGSSISRAAWAIAELMRKKDEQLMSMMLILMVVACLTGGAGAYLSYQNGQKITIVDTNVAALQSSINQHFNTGQGNGTYVFPPLTMPTTVPITVSTTPTPTQTIVVG